MRAKVTSFLISSRWKMQRGKNPIKAITLVVNGIEQRFEVDKNQKFHELKKTKRSMRQFIKRARTSIFDETLLTDFDFQFDSSPLVERENINNQINTNKEIQTEKPTESINSAEQPSVEFVDYFNEIDCIDAIEWTDINEDEFFSFE